MISKYEPALSLKVQNMYTQMRREVELSTSKRYLKNVAILLGTFSFCFLLRAGLTFYQTWPNWKDCFNKDSKCPSGYTWSEETQYCYKCSAIPHSFERAREQCLAEDAEILSVHSHEENDFVVDLYWRTLAAQITATDFHPKHTAIWLGIEYNGKQWNWVDGSPLDFQKWAPGEPNWLDTSKDHWAHIELRGVGDFYENWDNIGKKNSRAFVCKKASGSDRKSCDFKWKSLSDLVF